MAEAGRVIAGAARGVRLLAPGEGTRPLGDRVKQSLFAALEGASLGAWPVPFLDLFAGSGGAGIEALSRGAGTVTFVERDARTGRVIEENIRRARMVAGPLAADWTIHCLRVEVLAALELDPEAAGGPFGTGLLDPPYRDETLLPTLERLGDPTCGWLSDRAVVVAKHFWRAAPPDEVGNLRIVRARRFGETMLTFYRHSGGRAVLEQEDEA